MHALLLSCCAADPMPASVVRENPVPPSGAAVAFTAADRLSELDHAIAYLLLDTSLIFIML
ncbi:hypothetical protein [Pseudoduganella flava]|uniref:Uncharacterized protein n=1 Tax=Pseudoduganella flava TaxID=871742 RepID=A0ABX6FX36_9BURK|nr:hypothetical protein [Pseudoduganella flava]QGZ41928.1 hypothetical protein GO485_24640 [Pseudoduganella flava]